MNGKDRPELVYAHRPAPCKNEVPKTENAAKRRFSII